MIARRTAFAAAAASLLPAVAAAQLVEPAPGRLEIVGLAPNACVVRTPPAASGDNMTFQPQGSAAGQITITETVDSAARPRGGSLNLVVPIVCNSPHRVVLTSRSGGLRCTGQPVAQSKAPPRSTDGSRYLLSLIRTFMNPSNDLTES